jgi:hypothetical protein
MSESRVFGGGVRGRRDLRRVGDRAGLGGGGGPRRQDVRAGAAIQGSPGRSSGRQLMDLDRLAESTRVTWWNQRLLQHQGSSRYGLRYTLTSRRGRGAHDSGDRTELRWPAVAQLHQPVCAWMPPQSHD